MRLHPVDPDCFQNAARFLSDSNTWEVRMDLSALTAHIHVGRPGSRPIACYKPGHSAIWQLSTLMSVHQIMEQLPETVADETVSQLLPIQTLFPGLKLDVDCWLTLIELATQVRRGGINLKPAAIGRLAAVPMPVAAGPFQVRANAPAVNRCNQSRQPVRRLITGAASRLFYVGRRWRTIERYSTLE